MLRDAGVRTKLLAVLAIPTVLLLVVTGVLVGSQVKAAGRAGQVHALTDVAIQVNRVVHSLQEERSATLRYLQDGGSGARSEMLGQRQYSNQQLRTLRGLVADSPVDQMSQAVQVAVGRSTAAHEELASARRSVDAGRFFATEADVFYTRVIRTDLDLPGVVASSGTTELAQLLQAYQALSSGIEYSSHERDLVEVALVRGTLTEADFAQTSALTAQQRQALQDFQRDAPLAFPRLDNALAKSEVFEIDQVRRDLPDLLKGQDPDIGRSVEWVGAANSRIGPMTASETSLVSDIATVAEDTQTSQEQTALLLVLASVLGLGLALMLAIGLARRITRPLRRLTVAAGEIGDELPRMVERMQTPGEGPGVVVEPIAVESRDEIGQLAVAFNTVNDVTVQVAKEQAALRSSIAEMFVNVARRNQVLLGRQLSQLDRMESGEEDPDVLQHLFTLDHLATRMRRNAESLLVLAGIDSSRRLRTGLPLSDVIRTAVGEIEAYDRIDLSMSEDPEVSGRHALTVAHLLAELLENATHFSNPETRVVVSASVTGQGVDVTVTDYGLGMSEADVADANEKIAHPPVAEIAVSQRLGLFVVGRLATRLGATVRLRRGRAAGTVVAVSLPAALFEGMTVVAPVPEEQAPVFEAPVVEDAAADVVGDADVLGDAEVVGDVEVADAEAEPVAQPEAAPARRGLLRRRRPKVVEPVEPVVEAEPDVAVELEPDDAVDVAVEPVELAVEVELVEPDTEVTLAAEPDGVDVVAVAEVEPEVAEVAAEVAEVVPVPEPEPEPEPVVAPVVYAAAVDVLPSAPVRGGRFGRHRQPEPATPSPAPVLPTYQPQVVAEPVTQLTPATPPTPPAPAAPAVLPVAAPEPAPVLSAEPVDAELPEPRPDQPPQQAADLPAPVVPPAPRPVAPMPRRAPAQLPAPVLSAASVTSSLPELDRVSAQSDLQASALSELRGLYEPVFTPEESPAAAPEAAAGGLARRTPKATADDTDTDGTAPADGPARVRSRTANDVRGMLSGFRAGVERGRGAADATSPAPTDDPTS